jgi:hypothetical protein
VWIPSAPHRFNFDPLWIVTTPSKNHVSDRPAALLALRIDFNLFDFSLSDSISSITLCIVLADSIGYYQTPVKDMYFELVLPAHACVSYQS